MPDDTTVGMVGSTVPEELTPQSGTGEQPAPAPPAESAGNRELTHQAVTNLAILMRAGAGVQEHLKDILERDLGARPTPDTFGSVGKKLGDYLGEDLTTWLLLFLTEEQPREILGWAEEVEGIDNLEQVLDFLRWLRAIYGQAFLDAYSSWQEPENAWMRVNRKVHFDQLGQTWIVQLEITKYNNEVMMIAGSPSSILHLTRYFLATLNALPDPAPFLPQNLEQFLDELETFRNKFPMNSLAATEIASEATPHSEPEATSGRSMTST